MKRAPAWVAGFLAVAALAPGGARALSLRDGAVRIDAPAAAEARRFEADPEAEAGAPISITRAVLYSLALPGLGDYALGNRERASAFFVAEGAIWISYVVFQVQGRQREDEYQSLAVRFAGVSRTGHSDDFYARLREYDNSDDYEADVKTDGRFALTQGGRRNFGGIGSDALDSYFLENQLYDFEPWQWTSLDRRLQYSEVRSSSKTSYRRANYMIAAAAANRLASAVVAYASARGAHKRQQLGYRIEVFPSATGGFDAAVAITRSF